MFKILLVKKVCGPDTIDLLTCQTAYKVEVNEKVRESMGIAQYNEYVLEMEDKHGKEKAAEVISGPAESLKDLQALQTFLNVSNGRQPKGAPKTQKEADEWTYADQARLEMGEAEYFQHAAIVAAEFGAGKGEKISGVGKSNDGVYAAMTRLYAKTQ
jgi:hypothetical protein